MITITKDVLLQVVEVPPPWAHYCGGKVRIVQGRTNDNSRKRCLTITTNSGHLKISSYGFRSKKWKVRWIIFDKGGGSLCVDGRKVLSDAEFNTAFDLPRDIIKTDDDYALKYNAFYGMPGKYIRKGDWLNIPCPGTGVDGDPNFTVYLFPFIKMAIKEFTTKVLMAQQ